MLYKIQNGGGKSKRSVGTTGLPHAPMHAGVGYLFIPTGITREDYVKQCYKTNTICIRTEGGDFYKNVYVGDDDMQSLEFPEKISEIGSAVAWICLPKHNTPIVVSVFNLKNKLGRIDQERQFKLLRSNDGSSVHIEGQADSKSLKLGVNSDESGEGTFEIVVTNPDDSAEFNVSVKGFANIYASEKIRLFTKDAINIEFVDENLNAKAFIRYRPNQGWEIFGVDSSTGEPVLLGDTTVVELNKNNDILNTIVQVFNTWTPVPNDGGAALKTALLTALAGKPPANYSQVKSSNVKID